jgi:ATP-dependent RNA helicase MSS116
MPEAALQKHMARCPDRGDTVATATNDGRNIEAPATDAAAPVTKAPRARVPHGNTRTTSTTLAHLSDSTFDSLSLHPLLQRAIEEVFHFERMTLVQQLAIPICLDVADKDVVAKARTGTGKTLGFLLPALQRVLRRPPPPGVASCPILVLSPTRELAMQTADEAKDLLRFVTPSKVMTVLGGTSMSKDVASFAQGPPTVLVATPGRLDDHLHNTACVRAMLQQLCVLVMDEADQLLDRGFRGSILKILAMLPPAATRQTLLFSATFPDALQELTRSALRPNFQMVDCVGPGPQSNEQVEQQVTVCSIDDLHAVTAAVLRQHVRQPEHKVMVFLQTAREAGFCAALFREMELGTEVFEIHSKKSQPQRSKTSEQFRLCRSGVLFSSDVSARGMDYPDGERHSNCTI